MTPEQLWSFISAAAAAVGAVVAIWQAVIAVRARRDAENARSAADAAQASAEAARDRALAAAESQAATAREMADLYRERTPDPVQVAYEAVLEKLAPLSTIDLSGRVDVQPLVSACRHAMTVLIERSGPEGKLLQVWFGLEMRFGLRTAEMSLIAINRISAIDQTTTDDILRAAAPFYDWASGLITRLRAWRGGAIAIDELIRSAHRQENIAFKS